MSLTRDATGADVYGANSIRGKVPPLVLVYILTILVPSSGAMTIGPFFMTAQSLYFLLVGGPVILIFLSKVKLERYDKLFIFYIFWLTFCTLKNYGFSRIGIVGLYVLNNLGVYALVQISFRRTPDIDRTMRLLIIAVIILGVLAIPEAFFKTRYLPDFVSRITGYWPYFQNDQRMGLLRASSVFSHQILYGLFCAACLSFAWYRSKTIGSAVFVAFAIVIATLMSLSSGPVLVLTVQILLIVGERYSRNIKGRTKKLLITLVSIYIFLEVSTNRGAVGLMISYLTFNKGTAFYRRLIWEYGSADVMRHPIFGMVVENWSRLSWMIESVDNFWLLQAMRAGLPGVGALLLAMYLLLRALYRKPDAEHTALHVRLRRASAFSLIALGICGGTVAFFGKVEPFFAFSLGIAAALVRLADTPESSSGAKPSAPPVRRRTVL